MSKKPRPDRRRALRTEASRSSAARRKPAPRTGARKPAPRQTARGRRGLHFVDMLLIAVVVVLVMMVIAGLFVVFRGGF